MDFPGFNTTEDIFSVFVFMACILIVRQKVFIQYFEESDYYYSRGGDGINFRAKNIDSFENLEKNSMDFYASVRSLYLQDRRKKIMNSNEIVDTQDDSDWEEITSN